MTILCHQEGDTWEHLSFKDSLKTLIIGICQDTAGCLDLRHGTISLNSPVIMCVIPQTRCNIQILVIILYLYYYQLCATEVTKVFIHCYGDTMKDNCQKNLNITQTLRYPPLGIHKARTTIHIAINGDGPTSCMSSH